MPRIAHNKLSLDYVKNKTKDISNGYECIDNKYENSNTKLIFRCSNGHIFKMTWNNFRSGWRCIECSGLKKKNMKEVREYVEKIGYECLSNKYENANGSIKVVCDKGHIFDTSWNNLHNKKYRCPICSNRKRLTISDIEKKIKTFGYNLIRGIYKNNKSKIYLECPNGHIFVTTYNWFHNGNRCPVCNKINKCGKGNPMYGKKGIDHPAWKGYSELESLDLYKYRLQIMHLSNINFRKYHYLINPNRVLRGNKYHLDHIYSIIDGFKNNVNPKIISSPVNLRIVDAKDNQIKHGNSLFTLDTLNTLYLQFEEETKHGTTYNTDNSLGL